MDGAGEFEPLGPGLDDNGREGGREVKPVMSTAAAACSFAAFFFFYLVDPEGYSKIVANKMLNFVSFPLFLTKEILELVL